MQADRGATRKGAKLHQVAQLVGQPQAAPPLLAGRRSTPVGERIVEVAAVANLTDQDPAIAPDPKRARAAAVLHAIGCDLVDRKHQVRDRSRRETGAGGLPRDQAPKGRHVVAVCHNLSCYLAGAREILAHVKRRLGVEAGETTTDGRVTLQSVECLCACEAAPMMQVDDRYEMNLTPAKIDRILEGLA